MSGQRESRANLVVGAVVAVVLAAALCLVFLGGAAGEQQQLRAIVHDGAGAAYELPLSQDAEQVVKTELGTNVVVVRDGAVFVREADCDNQDCVHQGALSQPGRQIICLPHKLWIEVVADGQSGSAMDVGAVAVDSEDIGSGELDVVAR